VPESACLPSLACPLPCAGTETVLGLAGLLAAVGLAADGRSGGIAAALAIGLAVQAITYLTAPLVALAADRSLARAVGNLLDIPAVAIAVGLRQPTRPIPTAPAHTPGHRNRGDRAPSRGRITRTSQHNGHQDKALQKLVTTGTPGGRPAGGPTPVR
jgi:hypothetical protein